MPDTPQSLYPAHVAEVQAHWEAALEAERLDAALIHSGSPMFSFLDDYEYAFRPNPHFLHWLPLTHHPDSALLVVPGQRPKLHFFQPDDFWYLPPAAPEDWWARHFDIEIQRDAEGWKSGLSAILENGAEVAAIGDSPRLGGVFAEDRINPEGPVTRLHLARTRKTPYEIACMTEASRRAARAHVAAEACFREGASELDIHLSYVAVCGQGDTELPYNNIVALDRHGAVLHYQFRDRTAPARSRSFLIDAGATCNAYAADITRTYARDPGPFADLLAAMDRVQQALVGQVRAGVDYKALHLRAHREIAGLLSESGIVRVDADDAVESGLSGVFYPHGLGHFLGLQTHDVAGLIDNQGQAIPRPEGHAALRLTRELEPGNVLTIEPGLYFIDSLLQGWRDGRNASMIDWDCVEELAPCGGIRIEDNVVVREDGCENLTRDAFAAV